MCTGTLPFPLVLLGILVHSATVEIIIPTVQLTHIKCPEATSHSTHGQDKYVYDSWDMPRKKLDPWPIYGTCDSGK